MAVAAILPAIAFMGATAKGASSAMAAQAAGDADDYNATIAHRNSILSLQKSQQDEALFRVNTGKMLGTIQAGYSAAGVSGGSASDVLFTSAANAEHDALMIRHEGELKSKAYEDGAMLDENRASNERTGGWLSASSQLIGGIAGAYSSGSGEA